MRAMRKLFQRHGGDFWLYAGLIWLAGVIVISTVA